MRKFRAQAREHSIAALSAGCGIDFSDEAGVDATGQEALRKRGLLEGRGIRTTQLFLLFVCIHVRIGNPEQLIE